MAFVDDSQRAQMLSKAMDAMSTSDATRASELYRDIVQTLTILCNKNQKEIASELQQLAKSIEDQGKPTEAFEFKQRTCAVMLEISMEDRRRTKLEGNTIAPSSSPATQSANTPSPSSTSFLPVNPSSPSTSTSASTPSESAAAPSKSSSSSPATFNSPPPTRSKLIGVDTCEIEPITADGGTADYASSANDIMRVGTATALDTTLPFLSVEYLYMGSKDYEKDVAYYRDVLGAQEVWKFDRFGSRITAFSLSAGPLVLLADHREGPSCQPVFRVMDLASCARDLSARGWNPVAGPFGTPNGEAYSFEDPTGNRFAIFQVDETSTDRAYFDPTEGE